MLLTVWCKTTGNKSQCKMSIEPQENPVPESGYRYIVSPDLCDPVTLRQSDKLFTRVVCWYVCLFLHLKGSNRDVRLMDGDLSFSTFLSWLMAELRGIWNPQHFGGIGINSTRCSQINFW